MHEIEVRIRVDGQPFAIYVRDQGVWVNEFGDEADEATRSALDGLEVGVEREIVRQAERRAEIDAAQRYNS